MLYAGVVIVLLVVAGVFFYRNLFPPLPEGYTALRAVEAAKVLADSPDTRILDVRTRGEYDDGHLKNAFNLNLFSGSFEADLTKLDKNAPYLVYCRSGHRSAKALAVMKRLDFVWVAHLSRGTNDWKRAGLPLVR